MVTNVDSSSDNDNRAVAVWSQSRLTLPLTRLDDQFFWNNGVSARTRHIDGLMPRVCSLLKCWSRSGVSLTVFYSLYFQLNIALEFPLLKPNARLELRLKLFASYLRKMYEHKQIVCLWLLKCPLRYKYSVYCKCNSGGLQWVVFVCVWCFFRARSDFVFGG